MAGGTMKSAGRRYGEEKGHLGPTLAMKRGVRNLMDESWTAEPCVVDDYRPETQRVDVLLKNHPDHLVFPNVPILGTGGELQVIQAFRTVKLVGVERADVGWLMFPRSDSQSSFDFRGRYAPTRNVKHQGHGAVFLPGPRILNEALPPRHDPASDDLNNIGSGDTALLHRSGSYLMFKDDGDVVLKAAGDFYAGGVDQDASSFDGATIGSHGINGASVKSDRVRIG